VDDIVLHLGEVEPCNADFGSETKGLRLRGRSDWFVICNYGIRSQDSTTIWKCKFPDHFSDFKRKLGKWVEYVERLRHLVLAADERLTVVGWSRFGFLGRKCHEEMLNRK
jgi:hypothetical protein